MTNPFENETAEYLVLTQHEGQYSLWPAFREVPAGWWAVGPRGKRKECLEWIDANWTDMRPKSLYRCRDFGNGTVEIAGGSGTPGPKAE